MNQGRTKRGREAARGVTSFSALYGSRQYSCKQCRALLHDSIGFANPFPFRWGKRWWKSIVSSLLVFLPPHFTQNISNLFPIPHSNFQTFLRFTFVNSIAGNETSRSEGQARDEVGQELNQIGQGGFAYV